MRLSGSTVDAINRDASKCRWLADKSVTNVMSAGFTHRFWMDAFLVIMFGLQSGQLHTFMPLFQQSRDICHVGRFDTGNPAGITLSQQA
jgi:hypothetical protein